MVDSCFKAFKLRCFRKSSTSTLRDSCESIFQSDKKISIFHDDKKPNFATCSTPIHADNNADGLEMEPDVVLRRHNRTYLRSISTTTSYDAMTSEDEENDNENLDILYPLPRVNTHDRPLIEETNNRLIVVDKIGKVDSLINSAILLKIIDSYRALTRKSFFHFVTDKKIPKPHVSKDKKSEPAGKIRHEPNLLAKLWRKKCKRQVNFNAKFVPDSYFTFSIRFLKTFKFF